jgi:uncharacterized protein YhaN
LISAEEVQTLLAEATNLRDRIAELEQQSEDLRRERDAYYRQMRNLLPKATPEEEADFTRGMDTAVPLELDQIIAKLESSGEK